MSQEENMKVENSVIKLNLNVSDLNTVMECLSNGMYSKVQPIISSLQEQAGPQLKPLESEKKTTAEDEESDQDINK